ncbi:uncharacterized protein I303_105556 [Kwoniella dejecticola CBS 10117]|uniref:Uncharacterized protein n=1 Tax=Kwoniella dejecticola CBS 10117 TaxID=1296121 RepID=A0A1A6A285_9TREE|nr:uncharacterized protein I303_05001 [Kwoniella dejecticola CBS 10117]OBR84144.1 hypothetical protein I303_05001 [Kwoniella dejecticola CBS 10117]
MTSSSNSHSATSTGTGTGTANCSSSRPDLHPHPHPEFRSRPPTWEIRRRDRGETGSEEDYTTCLPSVLESPSVLSLTPNEAVDGTKRRKKFMEEDQRKERSKRRRGESHYRRTVEKPRGPPSWLITRSRSYHPAAPVAAPTPGASSWPSTSTHTHGATATPIPSSTATATHFSGSNQISPSYTSIDAGGDILQPPASSTSVFVPPTSAAYNQPVLPSATYAFPPHIYHHPTPHGTSAQKWDRHYTSPPVLASDLFTLPQVTSFDSDTSVETRRWSEPCLPYKEVAPMEKSLSQGSDCSSASQPLLGIYGDHTSAQITHTATPWDLLINPSYSIHWQSPTSLPPKPINQPSCSAVPTAYDTTGSQSDPSPQNYIYPFGEG